MTREEEALVRITKRISQKDQEYLNKWYQDAMAFKELSNPLEESEEVKVKDDIYFARREAYYDEFEMRVCYGYSIYKWDKTYTEKKLSPVSTATFKFKNWVEVYHAHSTEKITPKKIIIDVLTRMGVIESGN